MTADRFSDAICRFRGGDPDALATLYAELEPAIRAVLRRYRVLSLPSSIGAEDLRQQTWIILSELALRWQPRGSFIGYFLRSFPRELRRYVVRARLDRGSSIQVMSLPHPDLVDLADRSPGGSLEPDTIPWSHHLGLMPDRERAVFLLRALDGLEFAIIGRAVGVSRAAAHRLFSKACARLSAVTREEEPGSVQSLQLMKARKVPTASAGCNPESELIQLVRLLHRLAGPRGQIPGRRRLMGPAGLRREALTRLLDLLEADGLIAGRGPARAGRLVEANLAATLNRLNGSSIQPAWTAPALPLATVTTTAARKTT